MLSALPSQRREPRPSPWAALKHLSAFPSLPLPSPRGRPPTEAAGLGVPGSRVCGWLGKEHPPARPELAHDGVWAEASGHQAPASAHHWLPSGVNSSAPAPSCFQLDVVDKASGFPCFLNISGWGLGQGPRQGLQGGAAGTTCPLLKARSTQRRGAVMGHRLKGARGWG